MDFNMNTEPVAYRWKSDLGYIYDIYDYGNGEPLYTHPVDAVNISEQYVDKTQNNRHDLGISHAIGFDDGFKAGMQRAVEMNLAKTLTEWEMKECWEEATEGREHFCSQYFDFAQLILRKAQEK